MKEIRPRLTEEEYDIVLRHRALQKECEEVGIPLEDVNYYWYKSDKFSINAKNKKSIDYNGLVEDIVKRISTHAPNYKKHKRKKVNNGHLLIIDPADVHIGKLASKTETSSEYNVTIAVNRFKEGVKGVLDKSSGFEIDKIVLIAGNDILHTDTPTGTTTSGTPQNTDGMWYDNFLIALECYVETIELLSTIADVEVIYCPSNHDYMSGFMLSNVIAAWFRGNPNLKFNCSMKHRKYFRYHSNLIGATHGDGAKTADLPLLMAQEAKDWSSCKHRYLYTHHIHHKIAKDAIGVTIESVRSPSGTDSWHHRNGYEHAPKAIEGFIHCKEFGQVSRITHIFI